MTALPDASPSAVAPRSLTRLIGRDRALDDIARVILDEGASLLTLVGPGGVGKTRLARQIAVRLAPHFSDGVHFVSLEHLRDATLVGPTIGHALGLPNDADQSLVDRLTRHLRHKRALLVLDNMEQVVESSSMLTPIREACPYLQLVVTSREALRLTGERLHEVKPLPIPPADARFGGDPDGTNPAVQLFVQRARAVRHDFDLTAENRLAVEELCRRTDGLPLAIELAAARLRSHSVQTLATRFPTRLTLLAGASRDAPGRLKTMRDAVQWSYDLLQPEERRLLDRLAIFVGGFTIDAACRVVGDLDAGAKESTATSSAMAHMTVVDGIASLVDKSLVTMVEGASDERFGMLETIREFAFERLEASGERGAVGDRHARWCLELAQAADVLAAVRNSRAASLTRMEAELDNLRAALTWFDARRQSTELASMCVELGSFWHVRNRLTEGYSWSRRALEGHDAGTLPPPLHMKLLQLTGRDAWHVGHFADASVYLGDALALARETGDVMEELSILLDLGLAAEMQGDDVSAARWFHLVLAGHRAHGNRRGVLTALVNLGDTAYRSGNIDEASRLSNDALALADGFDDRDVACLVRGNLGQIALHLGDAGGAWLQFEQGLDLALATRNDLLLADTLAGMAGVALTRDRLADAGRLIGAANAFRERFGALLLPHHLMARRIGEELRTRLPIDVIERLLAEGSAFTIDEARATAQRLAVTEPDAVPPPGLATLSGRERMVLKLLAEGKADRTIGDELFISHRTAMRHVSSIFRKLGVNNRAAAGSIARQHGLD